MSQIPHLLVPYLDLPEEGNLTLLTSVLGASTNWLVLRYLQTYLKASTPNERENGDVKVLLVSLLRDAGFWREGARKLGIDLDRAAQAHKFAFIDGLTSLFLPPVTRAGAKPDPFTLTNPSLPQIQTTFLKTITALKSSSPTTKVVLILDAPDVLLATSTGDGKDGITSTTILDLLMTLRQEVHSTVLTLNADQPLVVEQRTPLEVQGASLVMSAVHQADLVVGLRLLDSGTARDVSGVMRISESSGQEEGDGEDRELLFHVEGSGNVRVFERGS